MRTIYIRVDDRGVLHRTPTLTGDEQRMATLIIARTGSRYVIEKDRFADETGLSAKGTVVSRVEADRLAKQRAGQIASAA